MRPGVVKDVLEHGIIKASAPGLFNDEDVNDDLPPIYPFNELIGAHANSFSQPEKYDEVWILNLTDNPMQLYWFRKDPHESNNSNIDTNGTHVEILCNREAGCSWASLYFTDGSGWTMSYNDGRLWIDKDGHIELGITNLPSRTISITSDGIHLGNPCNAQHPATYGDVTAELLRDILSKIINACMTAGMGSPMTVPLASALIKNLSPLTLKTSDICSNHVKID